MTHITIGIDISKALLDVATYPEDEFKQFSNDPKGHKALAKWLDTREVKLIIFEATGVYHRGLERFLGQGGFPFAKINPYQARCFAEATGKLAKTDKVDSLMLARFGELLEPPLSAGKSQTLEELGELVCARRTLVKDRTAARNRQHNLKTGLLKRQTTRRLRQIEADIAAIDTECLVLIKGDETLVHRYDILISIPGIGQTTAIIMLAEMPELGTMDKRQTAALAGLAPISRQSGTWKGKSFIRGGRANLRQALYMPAMVAIRCNDELKARHNKFIVSGKPFKVAITAIMRKLIITANALLRDNRKWAKITA
ncbi:Mobile element protein [hydrothermal vent metagenome]|uniref:Mobile element protein n=1 Tax=hydrothermal vent metagenome TaxID=652676 RepID=A0A3B0R242_9ZZZZ